MSRDEEQEPELETPTESPEDRSVRAGELCNQACEDCGVKVSAWEELTAWNKYVDGEIDQAQLNDEARQEIEQLSKNFGKYVVIEKEEVDDHQHDQDRKERAELASRIYRRACKDAGVQLHFFHNFTIWSDFVNGKIGESEFYEKAMMELKELTN
jgi:hypothetical protein